MTAGGCTNPLPLGRLVDYWAGALSAEEETGLEEHVFSCEDCSRRLRGVAVLARGAADLVRRRGGLRMGLTESLARRLAGEGLKIREYRATPGQSVNCAIGRDDDLVVTRLDADLQGIEHVDLAILAGGKLLERITDVPIDRTAGQVIYADAGDTMRTLPPMTLTVQLIAVEAGGERPVGEYTFVHAGLIE